MEYKVGEPIKVKYIPGKFKTGLTNVKAEIYDESGAEIVGSPFTMTELNDGAPTPTNLGIYEVEFTPDMQGIWTTICYYGMAQKSKKAQTYKVEGTDIDELAKSSEIDSVKGTDFDENEDSLKKISDAIEDIAERGDII